MTREEAWREYVEKNNMEVPQDRLEEEIRMIRADLMHQMRYDTMSGGPIHPFPELELEQQKEDIYAAALWEVKSELVIRELIQTLDITVTKEELESEAEGMAQRQNTTVREIKRFFGDNLRMLEWDVKKQKAMALALSESDFR